MYNHICQYCFICLSPSVLNFDDYDGDHSCCILYILRSNNDVVIDRYLLVITFAISKQMILKTYLAVIHFFFVPVQRLTKQITVLFTNKL